MNFAAKPDRDRLDRLLDDVLGDLPEQKAPGILLPDVMARVARDEGKERQSWLAPLQWSVVLVSTGCVLLASYFSPEVLAYLSRYLATIQFAGEIESVNAGIQLFPTVFTALGKLVLLISLTALYPLATVVIVFSACFFAGMATLIYRLMVSVAHRPTANLFCYE